MDQQGDAIAAMSATTKELIGKATLFGLDGIENFLLKRGNQEHDHCCSTQNREIGKHVE